MTKDNGPESARPENGISQEAPPLSQSDIGQSPILTVIRKRLRAANKRLKRIEDIEGARAAGKTLDADQEESLRSKPKVLANIEELERLQPLLREARNEDKAQVEAACKAEAEAAAEEASASRIADLEAAKQAAEEQAASARAEAEAARSEAAQLQSSSQGSQGAEASVHRLVELMYFASVFADDGAHHHKAERHACVSYDTYGFQSSQAEAQPLSEDDLKLVARLGNLLTQRPLGPRGETMTHKDVIDSCAQAAMDFLQKSNGTIPGLDNTAERVAEILDRVLSLDYATVTPEVQTAQPPESAPHHHAEAAPAHNGFFEQTLQMAGVPYSASEAAPHSAGYGAASEPSPAHYPAMFQPPPAHQPSQPATQEEAQEKPSYDSAPAANPPIQFMTESMVEMEGGHPEPMGAAATEPMPSSADPSPARTILQSLQQGEGAPAPQAASGQAPPPAEASRGWDGRGGRHRGGPRGSFGRGGRDERARGPPRGRGPPGPRVSGDLGPRSASGDYRGGRGGGGGRRGGPRGSGRAGPAAQPVS